MKEHDVFQQHPTFSSQLELIKDIIKGANQLVPGVVVISIVLTAATILISLLSVELIIGIVLLLVLFGSLVIYMGTRDYGQAALALVAGLLTVFAVEWTTARFIAFIVAWVWFSLTAMIVAFIRRFARLEQIYTHAAGLLAKDTESIKRLAKQLQDIGNKGTRYHQLQIIERAEVIRMLAIRKIPIDSIAETLVSIEIFSIVTGIDSKDATLFIADLRTIIQAQTPERAQTIVDQVLTLIRESAVPPTDFIEAFQQSRSLILSKTLPPELYFNKVMEALEVGVAPEEVKEELLAKAAAWRRQS